MSTKTEQDNVDLQAEVDKLKKDDAAIQAQLKEIADTTALIKRAVQRQETLVEQLAEQVIKLIVPEKK